MIKQIIITWIKMLVAVLAIILLVSFYFKAYQIDCLIIYAIVTLVLAFVVEIIRDVKTKLSSF